jgi:hypothetical protein
VDLRIWGREEKSNEPSPPQKTLSRPGHGTFFLFFFLFFFFFEKFKERIDENELYNCIGFSFLIVLLGYR